MEKQFIAGNENTRLVKSAGISWKGAGQLRSQDELCFIELQNFRFMIF
jgi:hypothetical protein